MSTTTAANCAGDGSKSSRLATGVVFIHQPTKFAALAIGASIATDATRSGKVAGGKMEDRFQQ